MRLKSLFHTNANLKSTKRLNWYYAPIFLLFWFSLYLIVTYTTVNYLPTPLKLSDERKMPDRFISQRAEETLLELTKLGPRVVGSKANEFDTVNLLLRKINEIRKNASKIFAFETDVQVASGSYIHWNMINMYQGVQNVIVKLSEKNCTSDNYLLINSHFDSAPGSPGGGDDGTMVAVMMEVLRVISQSKGPLEHPIVFLFNGAEENPLQASHAFVTQHKWASNCKALINLDSAGNGGREILFQSGPQNGWLMKHYCNSVPHPLATTIAEELFQNNFIPSDTDFRIFRDHGNIPGLDMAHTYNGYVYHTKHDRSSIISRGTFQNTGDNVLELAKSIANAPEMHNTAAHKDGHVIFFDFLGFFMISYSETIGIAINIGISVIALIAICISIYIMALSSGINLLKIVRTFAVTFIIQLLSLSLGYGISILIAVFMDSINRSMTWFSANWIIFGLYYCSMFFGIGILPTYFLHTEDDSLGLISRIQLILHSQCLFLILLTLTLTAMGIRSAFLPMLAVFFNILVMGINIFTKWNRRVHHFILTVTASQILPFIYYCYILCIAFYTLIPMQGRSGNSSNPEITMASLAFLTSVLLAGFILPMLMFFRHTKIIFFSFLVITLLFVVVALTPIGFPYAQEVAVQRFSFIHSKRILHNYDGSTRMNESGIYVYPQDRNLHSVDAYIPNDQTNFTKISSFCKSEMLCALPHFNHRWNKAREGNIWIPLEEFPILPGEDPKLNLLKKTRSSNNSMLMQFEFEVRGPDHMTIFIGVRNEAKISNWSFNEALFEKMEPPFFIYFSYGKDVSPLKFLIEIEKFDQNFDNATLEIGIGGHWIHHNITRSNQYQTFVNNFPRWTYISDWVASYESWIF